MKGVILLSALFLVAGLSASESSFVSRDRYLDLMETAVGAYSAERRADYLARVEKDGIKEHGFARLTANLGYLLAHGRVPDQRDLVIRLMDVCCRQMPTAKVRNGYAVGNDFGVKEVVLALLALEKAGTFDKTLTDVWRAELAKIKPREAYSSISKATDTTAHNWSVFGAASEQLRIYAGLGGDAAFVDEQLANQLKFFDANGMYRDPNCPVVYDFVTRLQAAVALTYGSAGPHRVALEEQLLKSADATLAMQSAAGEIPYGGRSNQFLHNETFDAALCEYYARFFQARGETDRAVRFRRAARRAVDALDYWLRQKDFRHIKNHYPLASHIGCEGYGYFDKYMVTLGSWAMLAHAFVDEDVPEKAVKEPESWTYMSGSDFHFELLTAGDYTVQFMPTADAHYDAPGVGRLQRRGAPPFLALSVPFAAHPNYTIAVSNRTGLALAPGWKDGDSWRFAADGAYRRCPEIGTEPPRSVTGLWTFSDGDVVKGRFRCVVSPDGVSFRVSGEDPVALTVPIFLTDGEGQSAVEQKGKSLSTSFAGWSCTYETTGSWIDTGVDYQNRNGLYRRWEARSEDGDLHVYVRISREPRMR